MESEVISMLLEQGQDHQAPRCHFGRAMLYSTRSHQGGHEFYKEYVKWDIQVPGLGCDWKPHSLKGTNHLKIRVGIQERTSAEEASFGSRYTKRQSVVLIVANAINHITKSISPCAAIVV